MQRSPGQLEQFQFSSSSIIVIFEAINGKCAVWNGFAGRLWFEKRLDAASEYLKNGSRKFC